MRLKSLDDPILDAQQVLNKLGPMSKTDLVAKLKELFGWHEKPTTEGIKVATGIFFYEQADGRLSINPS